MFFTALLICNVVEAHCYAVDRGKVIFSIIRGRININLIAGRFSLVYTSLFTSSCQCLLYKHLSHTAVSQFCKQLTKAYEAKTSCNQVVIDSATYLFKINLPSLICIVYKQVYGEWVLSETLKQLCTYKIV